MHDRTSFHNFYLSATATTEIYTSFPTRRSSDLVGGEIEFDQRKLWMEFMIGDEVQIAAARMPGRRTLVKGPAGDARSEEHTSELQSHVNLVCRLLLEKKKKYR